MSGRNINIYLNENLHQQLLPLIRERKLSKFINEAIAEKLAMEKQRIQKQFQSRLIADYQSVARSKRTQQEVQIWDETLNDTWTNNKSSNSKKNAQ